MMKYYAFLLAVSASVSAWGPGFGGWGNFPSCASSCAPSWGSGTSCSGGGNWGTCFCQDQTLITDTNKCVANSSCSDADKSTTYKNIAQLCADVGVHVTATPQATFSVTSGSGAWSSGWGQGSSNWGPGYGPFGGSWGSGAWTSSGEWTKGPWTAWWGGKGCPDATWDGWTSGSWSIQAPWTTWSACTETTTATKTFTTTAAGSVITGVTYGVRVAEQTGSALSITSSKTGSGTSATGATQSASSATKATSRDSAGLVFVVVSLASVFLGMVMVF